MENKIFNKINNALKTLDKIADTYGCVRAANITFLSSDLIELKEMVGCLAGELDELRKFKEEHTDEDHSDEVQAES